MLLNINIYIITYYQMLAFTACHISTAKSITYELTKMHVVLVLILAKKGIINIFLRTYQH